MCVCVCVCVYAPVCMSENMHVCTYTSCLKCVNGVRAICELCMCVLHICTLHPLPTHTNHTFTVIATHKHVCTPTHFFSNKVHTDTCTYAFMQSHTYTQYTNSTPNPSPPLTHTCTPNHPPDPSPPLTHTCHSL